MTQTHIHAVLTEAQSTLYNLFSVVTVFGKLKRLSLGREIGLNMTNYFPFIFSGAPNYYMGTKDVSSVHAL